MVRGRRLGLGVNVDHVATIRQARLADYPDPVAAALASGLPISISMWCPIS